MKDSFTNAKRGGYIYTATLLLFLTVSFLARLILQFSGAGRVVSITVTSLISVVVFIVSAVIYTGKDLRKLSLNKFSPVYALPMVLLAVGMFLGLGFVNSVISRGVESLGGKVTEIYIPLDNGFQFAIFSVVLCLLPAVAEEIFFRGVMLSYLSKVPVAFRVVTVALCFALYHGNVSQLAYQFVYGAGLCTLTLKSKSIIPAMIAHFVNNFFALLMFYFNVDIDLFNPIFISIGGALLVLFALFSALYRRKNVQIQGGERIKEFYIPFGIVGVIASAIIVVLSAISV